MVLGVKESEEVTRIVLMALVCPQILVVGNYSYNCSDIIEFVQLESRVRAGGKVMKYGEKV